jgi:hypothetical protein
VNFTVRSGSASNRLREHGQLWRGSSHTSTISRGTKAKDCDEVAKHIRWACCGKGENWDILIVQPELGQIPIIGTKDRDK